MSERDSQSTLPTSNKESPEDRARRIMEHDYPIYRDFFEKYGLGPKWPPPSCLVCGDVVVAPAVKHAELAGIVVCQRCKTASDAARRPPDETNRDEVQRSIDRNTAYERDIAALTELANHLRHCRECGESDVERCDVGWPLWQACFSEKAEPSQSSEQR